MKMQFQVGEILSCEAVAKSKNPELLALEGDHGGNQVIRRHAEEFRLVEIPPLELADCDTPQALEDLKDAAD